MFLGRFSPRNWIFPNWLKFGTRIHCNTLITILMFTFSKFFSFTFWELIWSQNLTFSKLQKFGRGIHCSVLITILKSIFSKFLSVIFFLANLASKSEVLQIVSNWGKGTLRYAYYDFSVYFFQMFYHSYIFGQIWSQNMMVPQLTGI